ncbi:MAG: hypothetical protein V4604_05495 [Bacteroidota bacterium]
MNKFLFYCLALIALSFTLPPQERYSSDNCARGIQLEKDHPAMVKIRQKFDAQLATFHGTDFGEIQVLFGIDSAHRINSLRLVQVVHPTFDSLVLATLNECDSTYFTELNTDCNYRISMWLGDKKASSQFDAIMMLMADGNYKKASNYTREALRKSPTNSRMLYYAGRSQLELGKPEGRKFIIHAAQIGDEAAFEYLEAEKR